MEKAALRKWASVVVLVALGGGAAAAGGNDRGRWLVRTGCLTPPAQAVFSGDGRSIVVESGDGIRVFDVRRCAEVARLEGDPFSLLCLGGDGRSVLGIDRDRRLSLWSARTGALLRRGPRVARRIWQAEYHPSMQSYVLLDDEGALSTMRFDGEPPEPLAGSPRGGAFEVHPRMPYLAILTDTDDLGLFDLTHQRERWRRPISPHLMPVFIDEGRFLVGADGETFITESGRTDPSLSRAFGEEPAFSRGVTNRGGRIVASGASLWRAPGWRRVSLDFQVRLAEMSPDGTVLADWDVHGCELRFFELPSGRSLGSTAVTGRRVTAVRLSAGSAFLTSTRCAEARPSMHLWSLTDGRPLAQGEWSARVARPVSSSQAPIALEGLFFRGDGAAAAYDAEGRVYWSEIPAAPNLWRELELPTAPGEPPDRRAHSRTHAAFTRHGGLIFQFQGGPVVELDPDGFSEARVLSDHPGDELLGAAPGDRVVLLRRQQGERPLLRILTDAPEAAERTIPLTEGIREAVLIGERRLAATAGAAGDVALWDLDTGQPRSLTTSAEPVEQLEAGPDGRLLGVLSRDGRASIWDLERRRQVGELSGCLLGWGTLALGPGNIVACALRDGSVQWSRLVDGSLQELGKLWILDSEDWVFAGTTGSYDASRNGYLPQLTRVRPDGAFRPVEKERRRFVPELLGRELAGSYHVIGESSCGGG